MGGCLATKAGHSGFRSGLDKADTGATAVLCPGSVHGPAMTGPERGLCPALCTATTQYVPEMAVSTMLICCGMVLCLQEDLFRQQCCQEPALRDRAAGRVRARCVLNSRVSENRGTSPRLYCSKYAQIVGQDDAEVLMAPRLFMPCLHRAGKAALVMCRVLAA